LATTVPAGAAEVPLEVAVAFSAEPDASLELDALLEVDVFLEVEVSLEVVGSVEVVVSADMVVGSTLEVDDGEPTVDGSVMADPVAVVDPMVVLAAALVGDPVVVFEQAAQAASTAVPPAVRNTRRLSSRRGRASGVGRGDVTANLRVNRAMACRAGLTGPPTLRAHAERMLWVHREHR
jgi:hypothetical protein